MIVVTDRRVISVRRSRARFAPQDVVIEILRSLPVLVGGYRQLAVGRRVRECHHVRNADAFDIRRIGIVNLSQVRICVSGRSLEIIWGKAVGEAVSINVGSGVRRLLIAIGIPNGIGHRDDLPRLVVGIRGC